MGVREDIEAAIVDYSRIFPPPWSLAPNLQLASRALAELTEVQRELEFKKRSNARLANQYVEAERSRQDALRRLGEL